LSVLISVDEALQRFLDALPPAPASPPEEVPLADALGRITAAEVRSPQDVPPFDRSAMDGFAVRRADAAAGARLRLVGAVAMGRLAEVTVGAGECAAIPTGGMIPAGADAVVPIEEAERSGDVVQVRVAPAPGANVVARGGDVATGGVVVPAGHRLRPPDLGALAGVGRTRVAVRRRLRVAVLSSGDEIVPADADPAPGRIRDMNGWSLGACLLRDGCEPVAMGIVADEIEAVRRRLAAALAAADAVLVSGGSSVGERDFIPAVLGGLGSPGVVVHGVAAKPGMPTGLAVLGDRVAAALPGNPVSALVMYELLVRPALLRLAGELRPAPSGWTEARMAVAVRAPQKRDFYCTVRLEGGLAQPVEGGSNFLRLLTAADGMVRIGRGETLAAGSDVRVRLFS
jgi:molybdopterin molybdotransferase